MTYHSRDPRYTIQLKYLVWTFEDDDRPHITGTIHLTADDRETIETAWDVLKGRRYSMVTKDWGPLPIEAEFTHTVRGAYWFSIGSRINNLRYMLTQHTEKIDAALQEERVEVIADG